MISRSICKINFNAGKDHQTKFLYLVMVMFFLLCSCDNNYIPKPRAYFRIDLPEKQYRILDSIYPYSFEYPVYSRIVSDNLAGEEKYWINIDFPRFKGRLHISYKEIDDNLFDYLEDSRKLAVKHIPKASAINEQLFVNEAPGVYGLVYEIKGLSAASPYQFYLTDSVNHFIRGSLYFYVFPNNDSLSPVINFIHKDIKHLINTFKWKE